MPIEPISLRRESFDLIFSVDVAHRRSIGDSHDEFERMLAVLRFSFSKELKFVRARLGKPYNSALGEFSFI
jgi:hypothetical protein